MVVKEALNAPMSKEQVSIEEHVKSSDIHKKTSAFITFDYELNDKSAKAKLLKAAKRKSLEVEDKSGATNLIFSAGSWYHTALPAVKYWDEVKGEKSCTVGDYEVKIGGIIQGKEANGKHVNTQVVFYVDRDKIVCHLYNTTQLIMVNGHGYKNSLTFF